MELAADWAGDERNVVLTLSRIWYSAATGKIAPKDVAANWAMEHLPAQHQSVLLEARQAYLGKRKIARSLRADKLKNLFYFMKSEITKVLGNDVNNAFADGASRHDLTSALGVQGGKVHTRYFIFFLLSIFFIPEIFAQDKILIDRPERKESLTNMKRQERF